MFTFRRSAFQKEIEKLVKGVGSSEDDLFLPSRLPVRTKADAEFLCSALDTIRKQKAASSRDRDSVLSSLVAYFQSVESDEAFQILKDKGLPKLRVWVTDLLNGESSDDNSVLFILKTLAMYREREDVGLIARIAKLGIGEDEYIWSPIFACFDAQHPHSVAMIDALREPLPSDFMLVAYLDMANAAAIAGRSFHHPFDTVTGRSHLEAWLSDTDEDNYSYAVSSSVAIPFIELSAREKLFAKALAHPDPRVRLETSWAQAKSGDETGVDRLVKFSLDPGLSLMAQNYLEELGFGHRIPSDVREPNFLALAEMANWLAYPTEFGRPPDEIEIFDAREIFWPPTDDRRQVFLVSYKYLSHDDEGPQSGIGMVGSVTFCLFGETTADMTAEDLYGCHCAWELEMNGDPRAPQIRSAEAGRRILREYNKDFS